MEYHPFAARLTSPYNDIEEFGQGTFVATENAVDFTGDFIPLLPLGSSACIDWVHGDETAASFCGVTYLSSPGLLRIVEVPAGTLEKYRPLFAQNTSLPAAATPLRGGPRATAPRPAPARIIYLSAARMALLCGDIAQPGQSLLIDAEVDFLTLRRLAVQVEQRIFLQRGQVLLHCSIPPASNDNIIALSAYSARLDQLEKRPDT